MQDKCNANAIYNPVVSTIQENRPQLLKLENCWSHHTYLHLSQGVSVFQPRLWGGRGAIANAHSQNTFQPKIINPSANHC